MSQQDYNITTADANSGITFRATVNAALQALASNNSGATEPATPYPYMWWPDTTTGLLKIRNAANNDWIIIGTLASVGLGITTPFTTAAKILAGAETDEAIAPDQLAAAMETNVTLTDQATIAWDLDAGFIATVTLAGNRTMAAPSNLKNGVFVLHVYQDGTGSRTITWNGVFKWQLAVAPVLSTGANKHDIISFICDGTSLYGSYMLDVR